MAYTYAAYYHHQFDHRQPQFDHPYMQPPHDPEFPYWPAQPHSFHSADQPWQQTYQLGMPLWEEPTLHNQPPCPDTQPWQQPPDPPDWQHNLQPQLYGMAQLNSGVGRTESWSAPPSTVAVCKQEMPRVSEGQILNPTATTLEHILARLARFEIRLDELDRRVATAHQPPRPDPDPPYGMPSNWKTEPPLPSSTVTGQPYGDQLPQYSYPHHTQTGRHPNDCHPPPPPHATDFHQPAAANVTPQPDAIPPPDSPDIIGEEEVAGLKTRQVLVGSSDDRGKEAADLTKNNAVKLDNNDPKEQIDLKEKEREQKTGGLPPVKEEGDSSSNHVGDVASMNHRSTSLDADARLIPPRIDTPCLSILGRVDMLLVVALDYHNRNAASESAINRIQYGPPLVIFDGDNEGRCSTIWCVFDPGGDTSPRFSLSTLFVASWFPP